MLVSWIARTLYTARATTEIRERMLKMALCNKSQHEEGSKNPLHARDHMSCDTRETRESSDRQIKRESVQRYNLLPQGGGGGRWHLLYHASHQYLGKYLVASPGVFQSSYFLSGAIFLQKLSSLKQIFPDK